MTAGSAGPDGPPDPSGSGERGWAGFVEAIVFDLDGVLVDTEIWWDEVRVEFAASAGRVWTESDRAAIMGSNTRQWRSRIRHRLQLGVSEDEIERAMIDGMLERYARLGPPAIEGAVEAVHELARRYPLAVASSSPPRIIEAALDGLGVRRMFRTIVSSDEVRAGKPAPDVYLLAAHRLGVRSEACLVVEDSLNGVLAARAAGMHVVLVPNVSIPPAPGTRESAHLVLARLADLPGSLAGKD